MDSHRNIKCSDWHNCYGESWGQDLVQEAYSHPAKVNRGLARKIYTHAIERGWLSEGDLCIDPFAGIGGFALDAMFQGLHWIGVELEDKFVDLGGQNIALWNSRYNNGMLLRWGTAVILQGDSRDLLAVLGEARAQACVSSPPYAGSDVQQSHGQSWREELGTVTGSWRNLGIKYGDHPANLGNMREGSHEEAVRAVVSSPPFTGGCAHTGGDDPKPEHVEGGELRFVDYGQSAGQLAAMKEGTPLTDYTYTPGSLTPTQFDAKAITESITFTAIPKQGEAVECEWKSEDEGAFEASAVVSSPPLMDCLPTSGTDGQIEHGSAGKMYIDTKGLRTLGGDRNSEEAKRRRKELNTKLNLGAINVWSGHKKELIADDFWSAARQIVQQCWLALAPGGMAIWVLKDFVRDKQRVPFCDQWRQMCEACGFESLEWIRAHLVEDRGAQWGLDGELVEKRVERKSFFRRLAEKKGSPRIDYEVVLVMRKAEAV